ncbi:MAG TPA: permease [Trebonia sp.]|nr:permease [Trebonia sp.]
MGALVTVGDSLREAFFMFWETFWALVLGFGLSGAVQAFVSRGQMQRVMGRRGPAALTRSSLLGMASSSCSYAASALAKSLFQRGADFTAAMVFMFASTNLVAELGIVLWLLIGWQFTLAEFVGGAIMIVLLGVLVPRLVPRRLVTAARERLDRDSADRDAADRDAADRDATDRDGPAEGAGGGHQTGSGAERAVQMPPDESDSLAWRLRQRSRWADAAGYTISDLTMLRREIIIGFVVAGFAAVAVPAGFWNAVFLHGHGPLTMIENAIVGPFVAIISFVCSVGNVPLAAALWKDGISFGGVVAFIFADLISLPLLFIYRKLYGGQLTLSLLGVFWLVMSVAGLLTELIAKAAGVIPQTRPTSIAPEHLGWSYTAILNIVFGFVLVAIYWLHRSKERFGGGQDVARDPVCGMQVDMHHPGAVLRAGGHTTYFCSEHCRDRYSGPDPARGLAAARAHEGRHDA